MFLMHSQKNSFTPPHIWRAKKAFAMLVTLVSSYARAQEKELRCKLLCLANGPQLADIYSEGPFISLQSTSRMIKIKKSP